MVSQKKRIREEDILKTVLVYWYTQYLYAYNVCMYYTRAYISQYYMYSLCKLSSDCSVGIYEILKNCYYYSSLT